MNDSGTVEMETERLLLRAIKGSDYKVCMNTPLKRRLRNTFHGHRTQKRV